MLELNVGDAKTLSEALATGESFYNSNCRTCHNSSGTGGIGENLKNNSTVINNEAATIFAILNGPGSMRSFSSSSNTNIANVVTYVRNSFGNDVTEVTQVDDVEDAR